VIAFCSTALASEFHVSSAGSDASDGSKSAPLKTISAAASKAQPGDTITVQEGIYRERINPPRGGTSDDKRITYQSAPRAKVVIKGSEQITTWAPVENDVWKVTLPNSFFGKFNPYNDLVRGDWYEAKRPYHTGAVYLNGHWLKEAARKTYKFFPSLPAKDPESGASFFEGEGGSPPATANSRTIYLLPARHARLRPQVGQLLRQQPFQPRSPRHRQFIIQSWEVIRSQKKAPPARSRRQAEFQSR
jgi:hypothetical protein